jgi:hypothetical protein
MASLTGVGASSPSDALAVGFSTDSLGTRRAVALHWNGTQWTQVAVPKATGSELDGVTTPSANDAWAVGLGPGRTAAGGLILHWDGSAWTPVPSPRPRPHHSGALKAVSADSGSDAWAVGEDLVGSPLQVTDLALHWDGTSWAKVPVPSPSKNSELDAVSADSPSDAWAVGRYTADQRVRDFVMHWDGHAWTQVPAPAPGVFAELAGVSALASDDVWAVGGFVANHQTGALMLHWNGHAWTQVPVPSQVENSGLDSVTALSDTDAWAVGQGPSGTLVLHWDGTNWTQVPSPSPTGDGNFLTGVSADSAADAWTVGQYDTGTKNPKPHTLLLHWNGTDWTRS